jgi:LysM repeat protein
MQKVSKTNVINLIFIVLINVGVVVVYLAFFREKHEEKYDAQIKTIVRMANPYLKDARYIESTHTSVVNQLNYLIAKKDLPADQKAELESMLQKMITLEQFSKRLANRKESQEAAPGSIYRQEIDEVIRDTDAYARTNKYDRSKHEDIMSRLTKLHGIKKLELTQNRSLEAAMDRMDEIKEPDKESTKAASVSDPSKSRIAESRRAEVERIISEANDYLAEHQYNQRKHQRILEAILNMEAESDLSTGQRKALDEAQVRMRKFKLHATKPVDLPGTNQRAASVASSTGPGKNKEDTKVRMDSSSRKTPPEIKQAAKEGNDGKAGVREMETNADSRTKDSKSSAGVNETSKSVESNGLKDSETKSVDNKTVQKRSTQIYVWEKNDDLAKVAVKFQIEVGEIQRLNEHIKDWSKVKKGTSIVVPAN